MNLWGLIHATRTFVPLMLGQNTECHIVNTASIAGLIANPCNGVYGVSKHAIVSFSETLYQELKLAQSQIDVTVVCPGFVRTQLMDSDRNRPAALRNAVDDMPLPAHRQMNEQLVREGIRNGLPPEQVASAIFEAIRAKRFYVFTHDDTKDMIRQRMEDLGQTQQDPIQADPSHPVRMTRAPLVIPTYLPKPPIPYPIFHQKRAYQGASGRVYPLSVTDALGHEKQDKAWDCCTLENEYLKVQVLPEIGGRIHMGLDKTNGYHFIYHNNVIKPALIGLAGPWCAGGIEFNWPQHHRPTTFLPLETSLQENPDGSRTVWTGETEPMYGLKAMTGVTLHPGRSYLKVKVRAYNPTPWPQPFMWWANLGVHANDGYRIHFPPDVHQVAFHDRASVTTWPILTGTYADQDFGDGVDASWYKNLRNAGSFMVMDGDSRYDFVQGYDTGKQAGTIHVADHHVSPGKKLFTWGTNESAQAWCRNLTDEDGPYIELMTGMFTDNQPDFSWLAPEETRIFEHCWYPIRDIGLVKNATEDAAVSLERTTDCIRIGLHATGRFPACHVVLSATRPSDSHVCVLYDAFLDLAPDAPFLHTVAWSDLPAESAQGSMLEPVSDLASACAQQSASTLPTAGQLRITLTDASGRILVAFDERDEAASGWWKRTPIWPASATTCTGNG